MGDGRPDTPRTVRTTRMSVEVRLSSWRGVRDAYGLGRAGFRVWPDRGRTVGEYDVARFAPPMAFLASRQLIERLRFRTMRLRHLPRPPCGMSLTYPLRPEAVLVIVRAECDGKT